MSNLPLPIFKDVDKTVSSTDDSPRRSHGEFVNARIFAPVGADLNETIIIRCILLLCRNDDEGNG